MMKHLVCNDNSFNSDCGDYFPRVRFSVDGMLGGIVRWLRFLGYDTVFQPEKSKRELVTITENDNRIFLTRDHSFAKQEWSFRVVYVRSENTGEQLKQIVKDLELDTESYRFSRCSLCNVLVIEVEKENVFYKIPQDVWEHHQKYWECPICKRIYWKGGHWRRMQERLMGLGLAGSCSVELWSN